MDGDRHLYLKDTDTGDSTKSWTVPAGSEWRVDAILVHLATTATVGNRLIEVQSLDEDSVVMPMGISDTTQAASSTGYYFFNIDNPIDAGFTAERIRAPLAEYWLRPGQTLKVFDNAAVAADSDDMKVYLHITQRGVLS